MFTPGPWRIGNGGSVVTDHSMGPDDTNDGTRAFYGGNVICETVTPSNAALIAMAPEMYEFLNSWYQRNHNAPDHDADDGGELSPGTSVDRAERILAMAEGRAPIGPVV